MAKSQESSKNFFLFLKENGIFISIITLLLVDCISKIFDSIINCFIICEKNKKEKHKVRLKQNLVRSGMAIVLIIILYSIS